MLGNKRDVDLYLMVTHQQAPEGRAWVRAKWHVVLMPWLCISRGAPSNIAQVGCEMSLQIFLGPHWVVGRHSGVGPSTVCCITWFSGPGVVELHECFPLLSA